MQKVLLRVYGAENTGKTTSISAAFDQFKERHPYATCVLPYQKDGHGDILVAVGLRKIFVGFSSNGDKPTVIKKNLHKLHENNCDIIVCASRPDDNTAKAVEKFNEQLDDEYRIEPYPVRRDSNDAVAIVNFIDDYIANNS